MSNYNASDKYDRNIRGYPEELTRPGSSGGNQWFGRTDVASTTVVVSTALVAADSIITLSTQRLGPGTGAEQVPPAFIVGSISPGGNFTLTTAASVGLANSYAVMWEIKNARP